MLFSNPDVAKFMNDHFVCAWESVRPVPRVEIDFGDGHKMTRTLNGNVITFLCTPDGKAFDVLPGLYDPKGYVAGLQRALDLYQGMMRLDAEAVEHPHCSSEYGVHLDEEGIAAYHRLAAQGVERVAVMADGRVEADAGEMRYASKSMVEEPIKVLIAGKLDTTEARFAARRRGMEESLDEQVVVTKKKVERPIKQALAKQDEASSLLAMDTRINERLRAEQIHAMLATVPLPTPADLSTRIYKDVLHVDVADPHLGLGRILFGAEGETK